MKCLVSHRGRRNAFRIFLLRATSLHHSRDDSRHTSLEFEAFLAVSLLLPMARILAQGFAILCQNQSVLARFEPLIDILCLNQGADIPRTQSAANLLGGYTLCSGASARSSFPKTGLPVPRPDVCFSKDGEGAETKMATRPASPLPPDSLVEATMRLVPAALANTRTVPRFPG